MEMYNKIRQAIVELEEEEAIGLVNEAIESGLPPTTILQEGVIAALTEIGDRFSAGEFFLLELSEGARVSNLCIDIIKPLLASDDPNMKKKAKILMATVKGDLHDIGKNLVVLQLSMGGFEVVDMGIDQDSLDIVRKAEEIEADVIALSSLLITTMENQHEVIRTLEDKGLRDKYKVVIGGGPTNQAWADQIKADGWAPDAVAAVRMLNQLVQS